MSMDRSVLEDLLPPDIGREALLDAITHRTVQTTPVSVRTPKFIGELLYLEPTKQFFKARGLTSADWFAEVAAS